MKKKKPIKKTAPKKSKIQKKALKGPKPYKKCLQLVIQMAEDFADFGDVTDELLDNIADLKKRLNEREQQIISRLASSAFALQLEIDEATPGNELQFKI